jgi:sulfoxide reductase heme-binding subunit YedZ
MTGLVAGSGPSTLWYLTRATGVVSLLLLTAAVVLGVLGSVRWRTDRLPRFVVGALHRNVTLLAIAFVVVHVVTTVADGYAPIGLKDALIPFVSRYRPVWLGLGATAFDLLLALVATSLLRARIGYRAWRIVHWLAYASLPVALLHALGTGSDARQSWLALVGFACIALVGCSVVVRVTYGTSAAALRAPAIAAALLVPILVFAWYHRGPGQTGWAARAGTPAALLRSSGSSTALAAAASSPQASLASQSFAARLSGRINDSAPRSDGLVTVEIRARVEGRVHGNLRLTLWGLPTDGGGVSMTASNVAFAAAGTTSPYTGQVVSLSGNQVEAQLTNAAGGRVDLQLALQLSASSNSVGGSVNGRAA